MTEVTVNAEDLRLVLNNYGTQAHRVTCRCDLCVAWIALDKLIAPTIPEEPPVGTTLQGYGHNVWRRGEDKWYVTGNAASYSWAQALKLGADPTRILVETKPYGYPEGNKGHDAWGNRL